MLDCNFVATIVDLYTSTHGVPEDIHTKIVNRVQLTEPRAVAAFVSLVDATDGVFYTNYTDFADFLYKYTDLCV